MNTSLAQAQSLSAAQSNSRYRSYRYSYLNSGKFSTVQRKKPNLSLCSVRSKITGSQRKTLCQKLRLRRSKEKASLIRSRAIANMELKLHDLKLYNQALYNKINASKVKLEVKRFVSILNLEQKNRLKLEQFLLKMLVKLEVKRFASTLNLGQKKRLKLEQSLLKMLNSYAIGSAQPSNINNF